MPTRLKNVSGFDELYVQLNTEQKRAVDAIEGPVMVIAGPGTGKTTILTLRIANIIRRTDTAPENILALTFTESGASAMRRKLLSIIGPAAYKVNIHTFHGFAEKIIEEYPDYFPRIIGRSVVSDAEQLKIIARIIKTGSKIRMLRPYGDPGYYVKLVLHEIHTLKRENISPDQLKRSVDVLRGRKNPEGLKDFSLNQTELEKLKRQNEKNLELAHVYQKYEEELSRHKYYDFDDMLIELIRVMEKDRTFKLMLEETYQYILADEHQDANNSQNRILELLSDFHDSPNLFIVGDEKQAIYRFQGASLENFLFFSRKYPEALIIDLVHNYRSHQGILDASHAVIGNNPGMPGRERVRLISLQMGAKPVYVAEFPTRDQELSYVSRLIQGLIKKGEKAEEIAVLYRENKEAYDISRALSTLGVKHRIESDRDILGETEVAKLILLCRAIANPSDSGLLGQVLLLPELSTNAGKVAAMCSESSRTGQPLYEIIRASGDDAVGLAYRRIVKWSGQAQVTPFVHFLQSIIEKTSMIATIAGKPDFPERLASLNAFFDVISRASHSKREFHNRDFIEYVDIISEHGLLSGKIGNEHAGGVRLMTAHRAKGLEFNHVFIVNAVDGVWGNRAKKHHFTVPIVEHARDAGRIEDERRLFYVAMTRARESVTISYSRSDGQKETIASQFISEIDPTLVVFEKPAPIEPVYANAAGGSALRKGSTKKESREHSSILDPQFVRSKFLGQSFSVTHLNSYLECPWKYFFVNLIRIPQAPTKHQMYGIAVHETLKSFFEAYREGRDPTRRELLALFEHNLLRQPLSRLDREESLKKGRAALEGYHREYFPKWGRRLMTEYSIRGVEMEIGRSRDKLVLGGKLDKVEFMDEGKSAIVTDFKTAKPKSRNEIEGKTRGADGNYKRQLVFYKLLSDRDGRFDMKYGEIDFIEPNERGKFKKERFQIEDRDKKEVEKTVRQTAEEIMSLSFVETVCSDKKCEYCRLGRIISGSN